MVGVGIHHIDDLILLVQDARRNVAAKAGRTREGDEVSLDRAMRRIRYL